MKFVAVINKATNIIGNSNRYRIKWNHTKSTGELLTNYIDIRQVNKIIDKRIKIINSLIFVLLINLL